VRRSLSLSRPSPRTGRAVSPTERRASARSSATAALNTATAVAPWITAAPGVRLLMATALSPTPFLQAPSLVPFSPVLFPVLSSPALSLVPSAPVLSSLVLYLLLLSSPHSMAFAESRMAIPAASARPLATAVLSMVTAVPQTATAALDASLALATVLLPMLPPLPALSPAPSPAPFLPAPPPPTLPHLSI